MPELTNLTPANPGLSLVVPRPRDEGRASPTTILAPPAKPCAKAGPAGKEDFLAIAINRGLGHLLHRSFGED